MTDDELIQFLHLTPAEATIFIPMVTPAKRAVFARLRQIEIATNLWIKGLGPEPSGVLLDTD